MQEKEIDLARIPKHIAIIMDGNGRWAKEQGEDRSYGHQAGAETVHDIAAEAARLGVKYLTLYTFSTENWNRPSDEVSALMSLLMESLDDKLFMENDISLKVIGEMGKLPQNVQDKLKGSIERTAKNSRMCLVLALSYSSRWEISRAMKHIAKDVCGDRLSIEEITDHTISNYLTTSFMPDPDLLIRTGGECRLSNYLLWQCAYTELYFCDTYWPDFKEKDLKQAIFDYQSRERRFGKTSEQIDNI